ncbi:MAG: hypothetical protein IKX35_02610 [Bacteroidales bacterium]|nr:hypothetical protein [Bacteroidales bacterium]
MKTRIWVILFALLAAACSKRNEKAEIDLNIGYEINGKPLVTDTLCYVNEAGNTFLITEIQWFLSNLELKNAAGDWTTLLQRNLLDTADINRVFYMDTNIPESQTLHTQPLPIGHYTALRFTFGLDETDNQTGLFSDPPESEMFWPDVLGGGYHYMKLNGKYLNSEDRLAPLAIHLGIGQNEDCTEFYQNYFIVELPIDFHIVANAENQLDLTMVIDNWFRNPHTIDFNEFGSHIMQNQTAQRLLNGNGKDVFRIGKPTENKNNTNMKKENKLAEIIRKTTQKAAPKPHFWSWESVKERFEDSKFKDLKFKI